MTQATAAHAAQRRGELPLAGRTMELRDFKRVAGDATGQKALATAQLVFTTGAPVKRYDWMRDRLFNEVLVVADGAIDLSRLKRGAPLLNTHNAWDLRSILGVVENPTIEDGSGLCDATFSRRDDVAGYVQDVEDKIIRNVSVGYTRNVIQMEPPAKEGDLWTYRVLSWTPAEVSLVPINADMDSQVRSLDGKAVDTAGREIRTFPCEFIEFRSPAPTTEEETIMTEAELKAKREQDAAEATRVAEAAAAKRTADEAAAKKITDDAIAVATKRAAEITDLCVRHNVPKLATALVRDGKTVEEARAAVLEEIARRDAASGGHHNSRIETITDEVQTRMAGLEEALVHRVDAKAKLTDNGKQFRGMSLLEMGRDHLELSGVRTRGMTRMALATAVLQHRSGGMMSTSDFGSLLANVANKRLRQGYEENPASYARWARRAPNAPDFKQMSVVQLGAAPDLLQTNEHGEFKYGSMTDGKEVYSLLTYGRIVSFTRQSLINDDLRGFDRLIGAFGNSAARLENRTVYAILTANAALSDTIALFHASHNNLGSGAIDVAGLGAGRAAMRKQKGLQQEELNIAPAYLIVPSALEQVSYQYTSANYVPVDPTKINEFRAGGRTAVEPVVESLLDAASATVWYLAAQTGAVDTVEYCYLDGAEGPMIESEMGFEVDGISYKCREDFAAKAIDFRGLFKSTGV